VAATNKNEVHFINFVVICRGHGKQGRFAAHCSSNKMRSDEARLKVKVKFSHTRYRALGLELNPVYRQSACR